MTPRLEDIHRSLGQIEGKLDAALAQMGRHESDIDSLKQSRSWLIGGGAVATFLASAFGAVLGKLWH